MKTNPPPVAPIELRTAGREFAKPLTLSAAALFQTGNEVVIEHNGETYRLRLTRQNKLILTK